MKIAILADIHGNQFAFKEVLNQIMKRDITSIIIAGDSVGYYYGIKEILNSLNGFDTLFVKGNHEVMLGELKDGTLSRDELKYKYGSSLIRAALELTDLEIEMLTSAPHPLSVMLAETNFLISHGSPWDINQYMYLENHAVNWSDFKKFDSDIFILGHTHHPMLLRIYGKLIINPGSVGQNRVKAGEADWAIYDTKGRSCEFIATPYDVSPLLEQCREFDPTLELLTKFLVKSK
jgi:predicted phosphodiesterase